MNPIITCKLQNLYGSADRHKEPSGIQAMFISGSRANQIRSIPNPLCWQIAEEVGAKRRLHKWNVCKAMSLLCWNIPRPRNPPWLLKHGRISIIEFSNSSQHPPWWFVRPLVSLFPKGSHPWTSSAFVAQFTDPWKSISVVLTSDIFGYIWPCVCSSWTSLLEALPIRLAGLSSPESQITNTTSSCSKDRICRDCPCWTLEALETLWSFNQNASIQHAWWESWYILTLLIPKSVLSSSELQHFRQRLAFGGRFPTLFRCGDSAVSFSGTASCQTWQDLVSWKALERSES